MKISRRQVLAAAPALASFSLLGGKSFAQDASVKVGAVGYLTGPAAGWGFALQGAVEFVIAEVNRDETVKIDGKPVKFSLMSMDSKATAEGAAAAVNTMASQGIKVIFGPIGSADVLGTQPIAARNGILVVANSYGKHAIGPRWPLVFHCSPGPSTWADPIIKLAKEKFGVKKVVAISTNDQSGTDIVPVSAAIYKENGIEAIEDYYQRGTQNFAPIVTRLLNHNPDMIDLASSPGGDAGTLVRQLRQAGFEGPFIRLGGPSYSEIARIAGGNEVLKNFVWYEPIVLNDGTKHIEESYKKLMGKERPENNLFFQWVAAARLTFKAMAAAGDVTDTQKIAEALRQLPVSDPDLGQGHWVGQKFFGINQEMSLPFGIGMVENGALQPLVLQRAPCETC